MAHLIHSVLPMPPRKIAFINPEANVKACVDTMVELDIGALVVVDNNQKLLGIVSERDIVRSCLNKNSNLNTATAQDIMFRDITILSPHDAVEKAMQAMTSTKRRHVLICENEEYLAILSIGDLLYHLLDDKARVIEQLENYIHTY